MKIESRDQDIRTLLSSGYYRIPPFQRPYSWLGEHVQEFWDDVVRDSPADYFIGSMVIYKEGHQRFGVVDGQQRLTTIIIFLAAIRNKLRELEQIELAEGIQNLIERKNIDNKHEFVLTTETSYPFFQDRILSFTEPEVPFTPMREEENLKNAYDKLKTLLDDVIAAVLSDGSQPPEKQTESAKQRLIVIRDALLNLSIISVTLEEADDAYIIFETLNTRGKDLALADLVKNHITKHLKGKSASLDQTKIKWERIRETIEGSSADLDSDSFIHHFWLSRYDYLAAKGLFKVLKRRITKSEAKTFLDDLVSDSNHYRSIHEVGFGKWSKQEMGIKGSLTALQLFRVSQQIPCVLSLVRAYKSKTLKKKHLESALLAIEKFHLLFTAVTSQRSSGGISQMYASLGRRIFEAPHMEEALDVIKELKTKLREKIPTLEEMKAAFPQILYTDQITKQRGLVKYILTGFDKGAQSSVDVDYESMTIEHLVPQNSIGLDDYTEDNVGQLGNLVLVKGELNNKLGSKTFAEKKKILVANGFKLPNDIATADDWKPADIAKRTERMAVKAYNNIWKI